MGNKQTAEKQKKEKEQLFRNLREELEEVLFDDFPTEGVIALSQGQSGDVADGQTQVETLDTKRILEAVLFSSPRPLMLSELKKVLKSLKPTEIKDLIDELSREYDQNGNSFRIREIAGGYEVSTRPEFAMWIRKLEDQKKAKSASKSALESLAILAYKQPVTKQEIEILRGVDVSGVIASLTEKGLVRISGRKEVPGRPFLYSTTEKFLDHFGLKSLEDLPQIQEIRELVENAIPKDVLENRQLEAQELLAEEDVVSEESENQEVGLDIELNPVSEEMVAVEKISQTDSAITEVGIIEVSDESADLEALVDEDESAEARDEVAALEALVAESVEEVEIFEEVEVELEVSEEGQDVQAEADDSETLDENVFSPKEGADA